MTTKVVHCGLARALNARETSRRLGGAGTPQRSLNDIDKVQIQPVTSLQDYLVRTIIFQGKKKISDIEFLGIVQHFGSDALIFFFPYT